VVAFSSDGTIIYSAGESSTIRLWNAATGDELPPPSEPMPADGPIQVLPDGKTLVTCSRPGSLHLYDLATGKEQLEWKAHDDFIWALACSPDGRQLVS